MRYYITKSTPTIQKIKGDAFGSEDVTITGYILPLSVMMEKHNDFEHGNFANMPKVF